MQTGLGAASAEFVVTKTIQYSLEQANEIMKDALYWERALHWLDTQELSESSEASPLTSACIGWLHRTTLGLPQVKNGLLGCIAY